MEKKELRRKLKLALINSIEETLNKNNADVAKKIRKITTEASKKVARKFYTTLQELKEESAVKGQILSSKKKTVKKAVLPIIPANGEEPANKNKTTLPSTKEPLKKVLTPTISATKAVAKKKR